MSSCTWRGRGALCPPVLPAFAEEAPSSPAEMGDMERCISGIRKTERPRRHKLTAVYGRIMSMKFPIPSPIFENRKRFCGFPRGVSMLPMLAATVSSTTVRSTMPPLVADPSRARENGTKVSRATSFVMSMLVKKHSRISTVHRIRDLWMWAHRT